MVTRVGFALTFGSELVAISVEQQESTIRKLGIVHNQTSGIGGALDLLLEYLSSPEKKPCDHPTGLRLLKQDLVQVYESEAVRNQLRPISIHLFEADRKRAQSLFLASLQYDGIIDRENRVAIAHESTFRWVLQDDQYQDSPSRKVK